MGHPCGAAPFTARITALKLKHRRHCNSSGFSGELPQSRQRCAFQISEILTSIPPQSSYITSSKPTWVYLDWSSLTGRPAGAHHVLGARPTARPSECGQHTVSAISGASWSSNSKHTSPGHRLCVWFAIDHPVRGRARCDRAGLTIRPCWICGRLNSQSRRPVWAGATAEGW